jgi:ubiquinone/menaquinone biosynthesis C-methylase UbiE
VTRAQPDDYAERLAAFGLGHEDLLAWQDTGLPGEAFDDWLTDRVARRPSGARARRVYGAEEVHDFARRAILGALALQPGDRLLEIGCGGGLLLRDALGTGVQCAGLDHSPDMAELAAERAPGAAVLLATAERLPFAADSFTAAAMSVVFFFFAEPLRVLHECHRVLRPGGRLAVFTTGPELRGTPAAPEPLAARGHFHSDAELAALGRQAGLAEVNVHNDGGGQLLTAHI